jgi:hypothetical protein
MNNDEFSDIIGFHSNYICGVRTGRFNPGVKFRRAVDRATGNMVDFPPLSPRKKIQHRRIRKNEEKTKNYEVTEHGVIVERKNEQLP